MAALKKPQWEQFAVEIANGEAIVNAYEKVGFARNSANAVRLSKRPEIQNRVKQLLERASKRSDITVQRVVEAIGDIAFDEDNNKIKIADRLKGLELLGRYLSIFQENLNVNVSSDLAARMREAQQRMRKLREMKDVTPPASE